MAKKRAVKKVAVVEVVEAKPVVEVVEEKIEFADFVRAVEGSSTKSEAMEKLGLDKTDDADKKDYQKMVMTVRNMGFELRSFRGKVTPQDRQNVAEALAEFRSDDAKTLLTNADTTKEERKATAAANK